MFGANNCSFFVQTFYWYCCTTLSNRSMKLQHAANLSAATAYDAMFASVWRTTGIGSESWANFRRLKSWSSWSNWSGSSADRILPWQNIPQQFVHDFCNASKIIKHQNYSIFAASKRITLCCMVTEVAGLSADRKNSHLLCRNSKIKMMYIENESNRRKWVANHL